MTNWLRVWCALALLAVAVAVWTSEAWTAPPLPPDDNARPPYLKPAIASALPDASEVAGAVGTSMLVQDGPPTYLPLYYGQELNYVDARRSMVDEAWANAWSGVDARTEMEMEVARAGIVGTPNLTQPCDSGDRLGWPAPFTDARSAEQVAGGLRVCATAEVNATQVYVHAVSWNRDVARDLEEVVRTLTTDIVARLPQTAPPTSDRIEFLDARARLNLHFMLAAILLPIVWMVPGWLLDPATWDRVRGTVAVRRRGARGLGGVDADALVTRRRWGSRALGLSQWAVAVWAVRAGEELRLGGYQSILLVFAAVVAMRLTPRAVSSLRGRRVRMFKAREALVLLIGAGLSLFMVMGAAAVLQLASAYLSLREMLGIGTGDATDQLGYTLVLVALVLLPAARLPFLFVRRLARWAVRDRDPRDPRPPIVLLRSFADDDRRLRRHSWSRGSLVDELSLRRLERFEEVIAHVLMARGPVRAVSQIGERLPPPLGALRIQLAHDEWQERVAGLIAESQLVALTVGRSQSLVWEIERIVSSGHLHKTLFLVPPLPRGEELTRLSVLADLLDLEWTSVAPDELARVLALRVREGGRVVTVTARAQEDLGYEAAIELLLEPDDLPSTLPAEAHSPTRPAPRVYDVDEAPRYDARALRAAPVALGVAVVVVVALAAVLPRPGSEHVTADRSSVDLGPSAVPQLAAYDPDEDRFYIASERGDLGAADFATSAIAGLGQIPAVSALAAQGGRLYAVSRGTGDVVAIRTSDGVQEWSTRVSGARDVLATGDRVLVVDSARSRVIELDPATGTLQRSVPLNGVPWAVSARGDSAWVTLYDRDTVVRLGPDLTIEKSHPTPPGPAQVEATRGRLWVMSPLDHSVSDVLGNADPLRFGLGRQRATISAADDLLVIEGIAQVTLVQDDGRSVRYALPADDLGAVLAAPGNRVLVGVPGSTSLASPSTVDLLAPRS